MPLNEANAMLRILLVRPGATDFDVQGRIKGCMDMPLSECGQQQVRQTVEDLADVRLAAIYTSDTGSP